MNFNDAGAEFFGLTYRQSAWLFGPLKTGEMDSKGAFRLRIRALFAVMDEVL